MTEPDPAVRLLRETLRERAASVDGVPSALPAPEPAHRWRPRAPLFAAAAAAVVVALAVVGVVAWRAGRQTTPAPAVHVPAGWKPVASLGVEIHVPGAWPVTDELEPSPCKLPDPTMGVVARPLAAVTLGRCPGPLEGTVVVLRAVDRNDPEVPGRSVLRDGTTQITWISPDGYTEVVAAGRDAAVLQQVVDTARPVKVDSLGCTTEPESLDWDRRREHLPPVRLDDVTDVVGCVYAHDWGSRLIASGRLDDRQREALVAAVARTSAGVAPDLPAECDPKEPETAYMILRVRTGTDASVLTVHSSSCVNRYLAGPDGQSALTENVVGILMDALQVRYSHYQLPAG